MWSRFVSIAWSSVWSLAGLALAPFFRRVSICRGVLLCEGAAWPRRLGWRYRAITLGHVVLAVDDLDLATLDHELAHVRQYERWGPLFVPAYLVASARARLGGGDAYRDNLFEVQARREAPQPGAEVTAAVRNEAGRKIFHPGLQGDSRRPM
ncbi:MAG: hypothetical protein M3198_03975 [Actinomycetota bacterium]|nr:hypothetical protein [Actinomycetota bacterium]